jgi:hypothetical protein
MEVCKHKYIYLEDANLESGQSAWIFYCKKCLDIQMKSKTIPITNLD